jgi:hypothetical protein
VASKKKDPVRKAKKAVRKAATPATSPRPYMEPQLPAKGKDPTKRVVRKAGLPKSGRLKQLGTNFEAAGGPM